MKKTLLTVVLASLVFGMTSCKKETAQTNPLLQEWDTPFHTAPFSKIKTSDYEPALKEAIKLHNQEIDSIVNNKEKPTFANTIEAYNYSGEMLARVQNVFYNIVSCNTNDEIEKLQETFSSLVASHNDDVMLNEGLFNRVKTVWDNRSKENLNAEQQHLLQKIYNSFIRRGALLSAEKKEELKKVNQQLSSLNDKYNQNVLKETKNYKLVISNKEDLKGLPQWLIDAAAQTANETGNKGKWVFTLDNASCLPFLSYCDNRKLRQEIFTARINRGNNGNQYDNNKIAEQILTLKAKYAEILGYKNYAQWELEERMAKTPERAEALLEDCLKYALTAAKQDANSFQQLLAQDEKGAKLEGWDMYYYAEKLKKQKYNFDEEEARPYFEIENVKQGCFDYISKLYGLTFTKVDNVETWAEDVDVYEVKNEKGHVGVLYFDPYTRNGKVGGAWCTTFQAQYKKNGKNVDPIVVVCFNYAKQKGRTTLTADEAKTIFHEMGHAMNEFLSDATYPATSGTNVPTDFVELPSQISEHWCMAPEVLKTYAKNEKGEVIPQALLEKVQKAEMFNQGFMFTELLAAAYLDIKMHQLTASDTISLQDFETKTMNSIKLISQIPPRYRSTYFTHVFGGGYSAGYYCYIWSEMLDADAFAAWTETGNIFNKDIAARFKQYVLSKGGTEDADLQYRKFRGKDPDVKYMLKNRGML
ncbi:MAG: M3 family metallopeptidase [Bacteroidales bacterium]|nr:M3 family metallopeptidase [Bacteroidales bacterium]